MNGSLIVKLMAGLLPVAPITADMLEADQAYETGVSSEDDGGGQGDSAYADYNGPTMEEEVAAYSSSTPTIRGMDSINIQVGDSFDPLAGVYALDNTDGNITDNIEVSDNNVDTSSPGNYTVNYRVENSGNGWFEYTRPITVSNAATDSIPLVPPTEEQLTGESSSDDDSGGETSDVQFKNMDDATISSGSEFDPKDGIQILDTDGIDITHTVYISGEVDTDSPGEYTIAYAVFDQFENPHAHARTITVQ
ncbi:immunoglobulin-like domain-containing protein [Salinicoccus sp. YB14-2]|uniref:immunoglobulin-like domain-containing protein n=1 Tax=Salinicoccus sp. YB14-2 TaxID=1572701 RepID=UPI00068EC0E4|nr:immunoglobulin-like domain-containing protein [Salinicoccus sp. YB14-2]